MKIVRIPAIAALLACLFFTTGCLTWPGPTGDPRVVKLYGGADGYELIALPALANIRAYHVVGPRETSPVAAPAASKALRFGGATAVSGPVTPTHEELQQLSEILRDSNTYAWDLSLGCIYMPNVALRFEGRNTTIHVVFCFSCSELAVYKDGELIGMEYFSGRKAELKALARTWFPELNLK